MSDNDKKKLNSGRSLITSLTDPGGKAVDEAYLFDYNKQNFDDSDKESGSGGSGGQTGKIEFRYQDAMSVAKRDDLLPPGEIKRLLIVHKETHKIRVDNQKAAREQRAALKEGKRVVQTAAQQLGRGGGGGGSSPYKKHPISEKAQFSGIDAQVVGIPSENKAETNPEMKDKLENKLQNRLQNAPKFNPRPRPPG